MSNSSQKVAELLSHLTTLKPMSNKVVVMPDFFLDRLIFLEERVEQFAQRISEVANRKGGSLDRIKQVDFKGGNAINTAVALDALGVNVFPMICTSKFGFNLLRLYLQSSKIDLSAVKIKDSASITTALEFQYEKEKRNIMLRDVGSLENFSHDDFNEDDYKLFEEANYVCIFNWAGTRRCGTELAEAVFRHVKNEGKGKTYFDSADPLPNKLKIPTLIEHVLIPENLVDIFSLNENEAITYAKHVASESFAEFSKKFKTMNSLAKNCAKILAQKLNCRIDLHATTFSATFTKNDETLIPAFNIKALRATGAGDAWNAGNIYADAQNFPTDLRLIFANAVAAYYISNQSSKSPTLTQLQRFLKSFS